MRYLGRKKTMTVAAKKKGKIFLLLSLTFILVFSLAACGSKETAVENTLGDNPTFDELLPLAQEEGQVVSVGMPDSWANWKDTWADLKTEYQIDHTDTDMGSAEEIAKFEAEKNNPTADIGDVGIAFGPIAVDKGVTQPYKTEYWDEIPDWAKDEDGHWVLGYTGTMAFLCNSSLVDKCPESWEDLKTGDYQIAVGDVAKASQAQHAVLAAALAFGGDEGNIQPGLDFFSELAKNDKLSKVDVKVPNIEKGEVTVALLWDFNALGYRQQIGPEKFVANIPAEGSVVSGYATIINKYAPHPNAAKLTRAYILSDEGQINLAKGFARPIRDSVKLPDEVAASMIPADQYTSVKPINDYTVWEKTAKELPALWEEQVQIHIK
jgi:putative spermidine/putrescine transport system substrate-binding protein